MKKSKKLLAGLRDQVAAIRESEVSTARTFHALLKSMARTRSDIRNYLDSLPTIEKRSEAEARFYPAVSALVEEVAETMGAAGIDEKLSYDINMVGVSLLFVCAFTKLTRAPD